MKINTLLRKYGAIGFAVSGKTKPKPREPYNNNNNNPATLWLQDYNANLVFA